MKILIAGLTTNYQYKRLKEEGETRGHTVDGCKSTDLIIRVKNGVFAPQILNLDLSSYDLIYSFVTKRRWEWYNAFSFINKKCETKIVNNLTAFPTPVTEYLAQAEAGLPSPKTAVIYSGKVIPQIIEDFDFPIIVKNGMVHKGKEVYKVNNEAELSEKVSAIRESGNPVVIREFIPNDGDLRIFTVNYMAIAAMKRISTKGEFRSNISLGGKGKNINLDSEPKIQKLAEDASRAVKVPIAGVDIIINKDTGTPYILEINSCPQFEGLEKYTGKNIALEIIKYFEEVIKK